MSAAIKDNKKTEADNDEVAKKLLEIKTQSMETCPHRKTPVSQDIGTLFYDCEYAYGLEIQDKDLIMADLLISVDDRKRIFTSKPVPDHDQLTMAQKNPYRTLKTLKL